MKSFLQGRSAAPALRDHDTGAETGFNAVCVKQGSKVTRLIVTCACGSRNGLYSGDGVGRRRRRGTRLAKAVSKSFCQSFLFLFIFLFRRGLSAREKN